jgi:hypothetical protein
VEFLIEIQAKAENAIIERVERLRERLVLRIAEQSKFSGIEGRALRADVRQLIDDEARGWANVIYPYLDDAWYAGIGRASLGTGVSESFLPKDVSDFREITEIALRRLRNDIVADLLRELTVASTSTGAREQILNKIGSSQSKLFGGVNGYKARAAGIAHHETQIVEAKAHAERMKELARQRYERAKMAEATAGMGARAKAMEHIKEGRRPVTFKIWKHSKKGNPPRANHLEMHGKAVMIDQTFTLMGRDGTTEYLIDGPHDPDLPIDETARCKCTTITKVLFVTRVEED